MKNHELLDLIGEVNEDYVQAAGGNVVRPRFRWRGWAIAACAACAALAVCAYPAWQMAQPIDGLVDEVVIPLHAYTVVEGGALTTQGDLKAPAGGQIDVPGQPPPNPDPGRPPRGDGPDPGVGGAYVGGDTGGEGIDGAHYNVTGDAPVQEAAASQYDKLCQHIDMDAPPEWFAGAWLSASDQSAHLAVAIVKSFRTPALEVQIVAWTGGVTVEFQDAKYSYAYLNSLMDPVTQALDGTGVSCGIGVDVTANCLGVDLYSDEDIPIAVLAELVRLDPDGDAIRVRVFTQSMSTLTDDVQKGPVPGGDTQPAADPEADPTPTPESEWAVPAEEPAGINDLPQVKRDAVAEGE